MTHTRGSPENKQMIRQKTVRQLFNMLALCLVMSAPSASQQSGPWYTTTGRIQNHPFSATFTEEFFDASGAPPKGIEGRLYRRSDGSVRTDISVDTSIPLSAVSIVDWNRREMIGFGSFFGGARSVKRRPIPSSAAVADPSYYVAGPPPPTKHISLSVAWA